MENSPKIDFFHGEMFVYQSVCHYALFLLYWFYIVTTAYFQVQLLLVLGSVYTAEISENVLGTAQFSVFASGKFTNPHAYPALQRYMMVNEPYISQMLHVLGIFDSYLHLAPTCMSQPSHLCL